MIELDAVREVEIEEFADELSDEALDREDMRVCHWATLSGM